MSLRLDDIDLSRLSAAAAIAALLAGCRDVPALDLEATASAPLARAMLDPAARMTISTTDVNVAPTMDPAAIRARLDGAQAALLSCLDADGSTGVVAMRLSLEEDGFVGDIRLREQTTYGSDEARACLLRIVGAMRFPAQGAAPAEVDITLDVSTRFGAH